ncbi:MAG TPA: amino acid permease [Candidatus Baltobacteraceae bacterium]|jgi:APA family basic amino acid/polyamine antiporter|nr:amino acid permease [Candidatus Baltobacteraceae bacterium]
MVLQRRLGLIDFTLITIGSVIGSGIFRNPAVVAARAHAPLFIMLCWIVGGVLSIIAALVFAELSSRRPLDGGIYAYLREAYGSGIGFLFGWMVFWLMYTGATAASAALFAGYLGPALGVHGNPRIIAVAALACVTAINALGLRQGTGWQNTLVVLKVSAIAALIVAGFVAHPLAAAASAHLASFSSPLQTVGALGVAMLPVLFSYNGFQSATVMSAQIREPARIMPRGMVIGVSIVIAIYLLVSTGCLRVMGASGLAASITPAADVMHAAFGVGGSRFIAIAIALSTLGYMSTSILVAPRLYFQLAQDGMLFRQVGWVHPRTRVPLIAILMHGTMAAVLAASGTYEQIVNWVTLPDWTFIALCAFALFIFRKRDSGSQEPVVQVPGHPYTTILLILAVLGVVLAEVTIYPMDSLYSVLVFLAGTAVYYTVVNRRLRTART